MSSETSEASYLNDSAREYLPESHFKDVVLSCLFSLENFSLNAYCELYFKN